jgi:hypothetical protein
MAIAEFKKEEVPTDFDGLLVGLNNGDLQALKTAMTEWKFKDTSSLLKFMLAILLQARENKRIFITHNNENTAVTPSDDLLTK